MLKMKMLLLGALLMLLGACSVHRNFEVQEDKKIATAKINVQLGMAYLEQQNITRAKQKLLLALDEAPAIPETLYAMGYFLESTGDRHQAEKYYLRAIAVAPKRGDAQNNYGTFLCRIGVYDAAIKHFLIAVEDPGYLDVASAYENAGLCALKNQDQAHAKIYFKRALEQDPSLSIAKRELENLGAKYGHDGVTGLRRY